MPRIAKTNPMTRLSLEMAESVRKQLEHIRDQTNADSLAEVIRRALAVYDILRKTTADGGVIVLQTATGEQRLVIPEFAPLDDKTTP